MSPVMQHWMMAFCCTTVGSVARVVALAVRAGLVLEEEVLVVADVLVPLLLLEDAEADEVVVVVLLTPPTVRDAESAAMTSASMSSKSSLADFATVALLAACPLPCLFLFGILSGKTELVSTYRTPHRNGC
jgi:hypothetical protein